MNLKQTIAAALLVPRLITWAAEPPAVVSSQPSHPAAPLAEAHRLFPDSLSSPAYRFVELYAAEAAAGLPADRAIEEKLFQDGVITEGGPIASLPSIVAAKGPLTTAEGVPLSVSVATRLGRHYRLEWRDTLGAPVYAISFPIDHLLLTRQTPAERETRLISFLRSLASSHPSPSLPSSSSAPSSVPSSPALPSSAPVGFSELQRAAPSSSSTSTPDAREAETERARTLPLAIPGDFLFTPDINNNLYLSPIDSIPVNNPRQYPVETLSNILTTAEIPNNLILDLSYTTLDREKVRIPIPLNPLLRHLRQQGCRLFFGLSEVRHDGRHTCLLMASDPSMGYCHSIRIRLNPENIENLSGKVDARLTAYIPLSRILSLFDENAQ